MMKSVIFDLDNTLYSEESYVKSGFNEVSKYLSNKYSFDYQEINNLTFDIFEKQGRGAVFDTLIEELDLSSKEKVSSLVYIYRYHLPNISLYEETIPTLKTLKENYKLGLITDGRSFVQKRKVEALNIEKYFDVIIFTDVLGKDFWKPSTEPFKIALNYLESTPKDSYYIGDDPFKDFLAPKNLGMKSIQVKNEPELTYWKDKGYKRTESNYQVNNLKDILSIL